MIIQKLEMQNIRSYKDPPPISFEQGILLFEGDIGSGKSTILSAIEFALFGLGDINPSYLLRAGERQGWVSLEFEVNGKQYRVRRSLLRARKSVSQHACSLTEEGTKTDYAVGELKSRILGILDFKERPNPRASSLIYRYAVFTPQEEMKEVILQNEQRRLETLRRALGLEEYSVALANVQSVVDWIRGEVRFLAQQIRDLENKTGSLEDERKKLDSQREELQKLEDRRKASLEDLNRVRAQLKKLQPRKEAVLKLEATIPKTEEQVESLEGTERSWARRLEESNSLLQESKKAEKALKALEPKFKLFRSAKSEFERLKPKVQRSESLERNHVKLEEAIRKTGEALEKSIHRLEQEVLRGQGMITRDEEDLRAIQPLSRETKQLAGEISALTTKLKGLTPLKQAQGGILTDIRRAEDDLTVKQGEWKEIEKIGVNAPCPRCKQKLTKEHFDTVRTEYQIEIKLLNARMRALSAKRRRLEARISELEAKEPELKKRQERLKKASAELNRLHGRKKSVNAEKRELSLKKKMLERDKNSLQREQFAGKERKALAAILLQLKGLDPVMKRSKELEKEIKGYEGEEIEGEYHKTKETANQKTQRESQLSEANQELESTRSRLNKERRELVEYRKEFDEKKGVLEEISSMESTEEKLARLDTEAAESVASEKSEITTQREKISGIEEEAKKVKKQSQKKTILEQYQSWLADYFAPSIENIERHVFVQINDEFNDLFQNWFSQLIETGDLSVRIDENFTPMVEQNGYELDYLSLSGGEKTSVALAYRLALNTVVKKFCEAMHTNLLILDEPTDGFSREQLSRMREILRELACSQVIIVSHENELESFVDRIYKVRKEAGRSIVSDTSEASAS